MDWLDLLALQGTVKNLLHHYSLKASILQCSAFFRVQLSHPYMNTGKAIALTIWTFVDKVMSLLLICHLFIKILSLVSNYMIEFNMHVKLAKDTIIFFSKHIILKL